jgi:hypothetical protein
MTKHEIAEILDRVRTWPEELQADAAELLMLLEARDTGPIRVSDEEWKDIAAVFKRHGV